MLTLVAGALQVIIAAGLTVQFVTLARCARRMARREAVQATAIRSAAMVALATPAPVHRPRPRRRDYRVALRLARASVAA